MIGFPNCKINLGLNVLQKRPDGYHDLETVFYPVDLCDALEITTPPKRVAHLPDELVSFIGTGRTIEGSNDSNLCVKAYYLLKKDFPQLPPVDIHLHKVIPMGAGLGGGSSDAAFMLELLNSYFELLLTKQQLIDYAAALGSDCPFFIINKPCFARSRGEMLEQLTLDLSAYLIILVNSRIHINTGWAFSQLNLPVSGNEILAGESLKDLVSQPVSQWKDILRNDFEVPVFKTYPAIGEIKQMLYRQGALYASMTGSGGTVFGIFERQSKPQLSFPDADIYIIDKP